MRPFELRGDGILLAVPTADDVERITEICQDAQSQQWTTIPMPYERQHAQAFVAAVAKGWADDQQLTWGIRRREDRALMGVIDLRLNDTQGEIGFNLAAEARGTGVMSRAVRLVATYAFDTEGLGLTHLHWWAYVGNWASRRVAWATGFRHEGTVRGARTQRGTSRDCWVATLQSNDPMMPVSPWLDAPTLHGNGIVLRRFTDSDVDAVVQACNDPTTQHWLAGLPDPYSAETALAYIHNREEEHAAGLGVHWAAALTDDGVAIGSFSLMGLHTHDGGAEIGYWMHPDARAKAVATTAVRLMAGHAFTAATAGGLGLRRLLVGHLTGNDASRKVIERVGFRPCGIERAGARIRGGTVVDLHWYDLLADDWPAS
jgi:RimJ/RimL family protein N-acetyltransferase